MHCKRRLLLTDDVRALWEFFRGWLLIWWCTWIWICQSFMIGCSNVLSRHTFHACGSIRNFNFIAFGDSIYQLCNFEQVGWNRKIRNMSLSIATTYLIWCQCMMKLVSWCKGNSVFVNFILRDVTIHWLAQLSTIIIAI